MRRDKEGVEITTLAKLLPYPDEVTSKLDKGSIIRLTSSYLRMKKFTQKEALLLASQQKAITSGEEDDESAAAAASISQEPPKKESSSEGILMLQALSGFVIFISRKGKIFFISDNVGKHLGVHQYEMVGNSVMEFIHPDDHKELAKQFVVQVPGRVSIKGLGVEKTKDIPTPMTVNFFDDSVGDEAQIPITDYIQDRQFFLRMRSVMSRRGTGGKGKVAGFRVVNFSGRLKLKKSANQKGYMVEGLVCLCRPIQPQPILEIRMDGNMFMSRHGLDMSFTFCDPRIITLIGYEPHELLGKTAYQFHNPIDAPKVSDCHSNLIQKGSSMSKYYRFMGKNGDWVWMQTKATIIYNTNNVAQYVVCMNYVVGNDEGERHLLLEQMQKAGVTICSLGKDGNHSAGSSVSSPASATSCQDTMSNSPASSAGSEEPEVKMEVTEEPIDVCQFIPEPVRKNEPILKPQPKEETISFAKLLQTDNLKPYLYGGVEAMDTTDTSSSGPNSSSNDTSGKAEEDGAKDSSSIMLSSSLSVASGANLPYSPISEDENGSPSTDSYTSDSPPALVNDDDSKQQLPSAQEEDENLFKDLLELTKNDTEDQLVDDACVLDSQKYLFSVNSPDNLSQLLGSPSNASICLDSPAAHTSVDDETDPKTPGGKSENLLPSGILAGLLNSKVCNEVAASESNVTPANRTMFSMSVTRIEPPSSTGDSVLPDDIADFSLDFCRSVMDQTSSDIVNSLAGNLDLVQSFENTVIRQPSVAPGVSLCELEDIATSSAYKEGDSHYHVISSQSPVPHTQTEPVTPVTPISRTNTPKPSSLSMGQNGNKFPIPVISLANRIDGESHQPLFPPVQDPANVTERISRLDIQDDQKQQQERTPLLHALLTGAEANPVAAQASVSSPPCSATTTVPHTSVNGIQQENFVDSFDAFLQDMNASSMQEPDNSSINNNMLNQDDLTLLQQQEQQRLMLIEEQKHQQEKLLQQQMTQQKLQEQKFQEQLLERKRLQTEMEMKRKLQQVQMQQNSMPQQTILGSQQQQLAFAHSLSEGQSLAVNGNNGKQQEQLNFPIPNISAADIQKLHQQKLHQQQIKQQLLLQQSQQQELQQMQQQQQVAAAQLGHQQQQVRAGTVGQPLLLQQALMQQPPQQRANTPLSPSPQLSLATSPTMMTTTSWAASSPQWTPHAQ
ncbi:uncharacterized protein [Amphiura filiformis]|uniref:uncharacterized protein n=1 Tax=Amphiura filiformis TaxID=82378 RepID=UPI003B2287B3